MSFRTNLFDYSGWYDLDLFPPELKRIGEEVRYWDELKRMDRELEEKRCTMPISLYIALRDWERSTQGYRPLDPGRYIVWQDSRGPIYR